MNAEFIEALNQIEKEKGISKEILIETIEISLVTACKNNFGTAQNIKVEIDRDKGDVSVYAEKEIVEEVEDKQLTISLEDAKAIDPKLNLGDIIKIEITPKNFGRIAAQKAKQVVVQKIREAEREVIYNQYITKEKDVITGIIQRQVRDNVIINLGKIDAILSEKERVSSERYLPNERFKVYVLEVKESTKGPKVYVSRTHPELVKRLFEQEVPEVHDGIVEIKGISREAGSRTKIAVYSSNEDVDPVGSCVGHNGARVSIIVNELRGEKIDIIPWDENPVKFISAALSPSKVVKVVVNQEEKSAKVIVPDYQLSLAIGKEGQNARLAAKLTGYRIDIKSETQAKQTNFITEEEELGAILSRNAMEEDEEDVRDLF
ncbi:transcription termination/antitermination protein NusA [Vallitalea pronyensis]|uniref:Transcription termination/antitermination protein NusA n=1 Tax=Vallitalea pronyensis TaxID=1348613 RepID=A0A8J8MKN2_9FIRM|nr:transcription termination factor NusA [Vallitalea pronyensis]QUI22988.1 transcription termination/antitermination protein NusA [Vallitalea pronyensis]